MFGLESSIIKKSKSYIDNKKKIMTIIYNGENSEMEEIFNSSRNGVSRLNLVSNYI